MRPARSTTDHCVASNAARRFWFFVADEREEEGWAVDALTKAQGGAGHAVAAISYDAKAVGVPKMGGSAFL